MFCLLRVAVFAAFAGFLALWGGASQAASIVNLDHTAHTIIVNDAGAVREITLEPNAVYHAAITYGTLQLKGSSVVLDVDGYYNAEYAIWPPGNLVIQKYNIRGGVDR